MGHTVIIPSFNTLEHLKNTYKSIKSYGEDVDIIIDDASDDGTADWLLSLDDERLNRVLSPVRKGHTFWYDEGMKMAKTEVVSILHSDMIIGPGYFKNMSKHLKKGTVVCATDLITEGIFAPWMLYKEDHLSIGGHDQRFAPYGYEDSDIFNRWILAGYKMVQSRDSLCYHMTCRGHRWNKGVGVENPDYRATMDANAREFLRKWGDWIQNDQYQYPIINPKYNKGIIVKNASPLLINTLEPWCDTLYVDTDFDGYIKKEQPKSIVDLSKRIKSIDSKKVNDIFIYVDGSNFTGTDGKNIQQLAAILEQNKPESGKFKLGNLEIEVIRYYEEIFN